MNEDAPSQFWNIQKLIDELNTYLFQINFAGEALRGFLHMLDYPG